MAQEGGSFDVRVWTVEKRPSSAGMRYRVRWKVAGTMHRKTFVTAALADSERSKLITAARNGEPFDLDSGLPLRQVESRSTSEITWWTWSQEFVDIKWTELAPTSRRSVASALTTITMAIYPPPATEDPSAREVRAALFRWAFNTSARLTTEPPATLEPAIRWLTRNSLPLASLNNAATLRAVVAAIARKQDGKPAAASTARRNRAVLHAALELATEHEHLAANPLNAVKHRPAGAVEAIDPRSVANPNQARALLAAVGKLDGGKRYVAFFGCMYYSALRPSEVAALRRQDLDLPEQGWGWLIVSQSDAEVSASWSDEGGRSPRQLKHRRVGEVRRVPCPPALTQLLHKHVRQFRPAASGVLFRGPYGGAAAAQTYGSYWASARKAALAPVDEASPLVRRPYDLRHSAVSTWLAAGVDSAQVAVWAGHSVAVLHRVYVHVLGDREQLARCKIDAILKM